jgi:hypothetical protein
MLKRNHFLSRREVLATATGSVFLAPFLRMRRLEAQNVNPKRLVICFTPDSHTPEWWPTGSGTSFTLQEPLADFRGLESNMLFIQRLDHFWTFDNHHEAGMAQLFTGGRFNNDTQRYSTAPSIDQILLQKSDFRGGTPIASMHVSAGGGGGTDKRHVISYSGPGQPMAHEENAARAFSNTFNGVTFGTQALQVTDQGRQEARRKILQVNTAQLKRIQTYLGQSEREKLELHVEALYECERRIPPRTGTGGQGGTSGAMGTGGQGGRGGNGGSTGAGGRGGGGGSTAGRGGSGGSTGTGGSGSTGTGGSGGTVVTGGVCEKVNTTGVASNARDAAVTTKQAQCMADLIVNGFTCDRTRIGDFGMSFSGGHHEGLLGYSSSWHDNVAHISKTNDAITVGGASVTTRAAFITFDRFWGGHVAYLAKRLSMIKEGNGTMLDNTLIVWGVESGTNHNHSPRDMQYLLIGGRNLGVKTGQYLKLASTQSSNKLLTSIMHACGYTAATGLGEEPNCGPLAGVL